ncbi:membrane protein insertion efficiency factor YidD [Parasporobacterium paucivorans]|uniref:Putative membrane protein insertion efficiency factor n=1 Tax=Parasporobacterium paucivorans DSM 15970 TaxID=1122934 RepID=A0A1M6B9U4_9FIRM|nr:membrane protein insertion efficiency factor YidD [Parasporobacterium paucivorans]SHI45482.1 hypothetical protein SAMN02745691_00299 [Parasporobacterium paucivorans DSM 15970]
MKSSIIIRTGMIKAIVFYRKYLSPLKTTTHCRYIPTCSEYAIEALERHGIIKGTYLALKRILRCNPFSKGGCDPVP